LQEQLSGVVSKQGLALMYHIADAPTPRLPTHIELGVELLLLLQVGLVFLRITALIDVGFGLVVWVRVVEYRP
jgi:hypothetical protein